MNKNYRSQKKKKKDKFLSYFFNLALATLLSPTHFLKGEKDFFKESVHLEFSSDLSLSINTPCPLNKCMSDTYMRNVTV